MSQYLLFTHGHPLQIETPQQLADHTDFGWGTRVVFKDPVPDNSTPVGTLWPEVGPGSWFHLTLPSTLTTFGRFTPAVASVTLLFQTLHCRITAVHVYDGAVRVAAFDNLTLRGDFLEKRDAHDVNPQSPPVFGSDTFVNTLTLTAPHPVFSAIGISFFACWHFEDYDVNGHAHNPHFDGPFPPSVLTLSAAGGQFVVRDSPFLSTTLLVTGAAALLALAGATYQPRRP